MSGISSEALKEGNSSANKNKYNGIHWQNDLGLNEYDAQLRVLDPQLGIWWQIDPKIDNMEDWSPYASNYDNPIKYSDPLGDEGQNCCGGLLGALADIGEDLMIAGSGVLWGSLNSLTGGLVSTDPFGARKSLSDIQKIKWDNAVTIGQFAPYVPAGGPGLRPAEITPEMIPVEQPLNQNIRTKPGGIMEESPISNTKYSTSKSTGGSSKSEQSGSYTNRHFSGKTYSGKGPIERAKTSGEQKAKEYNDPVKKTNWKSSPNEREAFKAEDKRIQKNGGPNNSKNYNKINSPGKKYNEIDKKGIL